MVQVLKSRGHARLERADHQQVATPDAVFLTQQPRNPAAEDGQLFDDCSAGTRLLQLGITA